MALSYQGRASYCLHHSTEDFLWQSKESGSTVYYGFISIVLGRGEEKRREVARCSYCNAHPTVSWLEQSCSFLAAAFPELHVTLVSSSLQLIASTPMKSESKKSKIPSARMQEWVYLHQSGNYCVTTAAANGHTAVKKWSLAPLRGGKSTSIFSGEVLNILMQLPELRSLLARVQLQFKHSSLF